MDSVIIFGAKYLFIFVVLIFLAAWLQAGRRLRIEMLAAIILAGVLALLIDKLAGKLYYDPRPFVSGHIKPLFTHAPDNGFPSEHTIFTVTLSAVLYFYRPRMAWLALGLSLLVGISRVAAHVHSPIDIIGGVVIGLAAGWGGYYLARRLLGSRRIPKSHRTPAQ